jgi:hypothetical protein
MGGREIGARAMKISAAAHPRFASTTEISRRNPEQWPSQERDPAARAWNQHRRPNTLCILPHHMVPGVWRSLAWTLPGVCPSGRSSGGGARPHREAGVALLPLSRSLIRPIRRPRARPPPGSSAVLAPRPSSEGPPHSAGRPARRPLVPANGACFDDCDPLHSGEEGEKKTGLKPVERGAC